MARPGFGHHPKFRRLAHITGEPRPHVRGYLELLWEVAYEAGNPLIGDATDVELAAEYPGEPGKLCKALLACRFVDEVDGRYFIHDLFDHAPDYVRKRRTREIQRQEAGKAYKPHGRQLRENNAGWRETADNGGHCPPNGAGRQTAADTGSPPAPAPAPREEGEVSPDPSCPSSAFNQEAKAGGKLTPEGFLAAWNAVPQFVHAKGMAGKRQQAFRARSKEADWLETWQAALTKAAAVPFCLGENERGWRATVDWFLRPDTTMKILEGAYDSTNGKNGHANQQQPSRADLDARYAAERQRFANPPSPAAKRLADTFGGI